MRTLPLAAIVLLALAVPACTQNRARERTRDAAAYVDPPLESDRSARRGVPGLPGLARVDEGLWRSAQPTAEGFRTAKSMGIRTVVDLRGAKEDPASARSADVDLVVIRTGSESLDEDDVVAFLKVAMDPARRPVLVHCRSGHDRTGAMVAAYRRVAMGWPKEQALSEMRRMGADPRNDHLRKVVRRLDPEKVRARIAEAPAPGADPAR
jgi:protein tyrosine phosphatase (PTP) superfamily phosphohydrolase (DUF442 family)